MLCSTCMYATYWFIGKNGCKPRPSWKKEVTLFQLNKFANQTEWLLFNMPVKTHLSLTWKFEQFPEYLLIITLNWCFDLDPLGACEQIVTFDRWQQSALLVDGNVGFWTETNIRITYPNQHRMASSHNSLQLKKIKSNLSHEKNPYNFPLYWFFQGSL